MERKIIGEHPVEHPYGISLSATDKLGIVK
jgi:hypothetical protein